MLSILKFTWWPISEKPPPCLKVKLKYLCSAQRKHPHLAHLWMAAGKKKLTHLLPSQAKIRTSLQQLLLVFLLYLLTSPSIQTPARQFSRTLAACHLGGLYLLICSSLGFPGGSVGKEYTCNESDTGTIPGSRRSLSRRQDNPLQYSCLENPMDRGAWWATVQRVAKSWTQLERLSTHTQ